MYVSCHVQVATGTLLVAVDWALVVLEDALHQSCVRCCVRCLYASSSPNDLTGPLAGNTSKGPTMVLAVGAGRVRHLVDTKLVYLNPGLRD